MVMRIKCKDGITGIMKRMKWKMVGDGRGVEEKWIDGGGGE